MSNVERERAKTEGYKRGLEGKHSGVTWGNAVTDSNEQYQARQEGHAEGWKDRHNT
jgi:hypothetical protein